MDRYPAWVLHSDLTCGDRHEETGSMTEKFAWPVTLLWAAVLFGWGIGHEARAQNATTRPDAPPQIAPPSNPGYWTKERMENARPMQKHPPRGYEPSQQRSPRTEGKSIGAGESAPTDDPGRRGRR
jgi:hypothetical protein